MYPLIATVVSAVVGLYNLLLTKFTEIELPSKLFKIYWLEFGIEVTI